MSETSDAPRSRGLLVAGIGMLLVGVLGAIFAKSAAERSASVDEFSAALGGRLTDVAPDYTAMWVCVVIAALGVVALIARAAIGQSSGASGSD